VGALRTVWAKKVKDRLGLSIEKETGLRKGKKRRAQMEENGKANNIEREGEKGGGGVRRGSTLPTIY